jgi:hypothetical protein
MAEAAAPPAAARTLVALDEFELSERFGRFPPVKQKMSLLFPHCAA